jgi:hypothetical protein
MAQGDVLLSSGRVVKGVYRLQAVVLRPPSPHLKRNLLGFS